MSECSDHIARYWFGGGLERGEPYEPFWPRCPIHGVVSASAIRSGERGNRIFGCIHCELRYEELGSVYEVQCLGLDPVYERSNLLTQGER